MNTTRLAEDDIEDAEDLTLERQWVNQHSWHVDGYADNE